jgi:thiamine kinase-like enzyme
VTQTLVSVAPAVWRCLRQLLGDPEGAWQLVEHEPLKSQVHRLRFQADGEDRSFVVKRSRSDIARRNQLVATRWLPAVGLEDHGPALLGLAEDVESGRLWHIYADLGRHVLETETPAPDAVEAVVDAIAKLHVRFCGHPLLPECRVRGGDLGMSFYAASVRDGIAALRAVDPGDLRVRAIRDRLLERLYRLEAEASARARAVAALRIPDTLVHGDLWPVNVMLVAAGAGPRARLIDWDHAGAGPISYDLSTLLLRFPPRHRRWILGRYRREIGRLAGWQLPADAELDAVFETAEFSRLSSMVGGAARAVGTPGSDWAVERLSSIDAWFEAYTPVLGHPL